MSPANIAISTQATQIVASLALRDPSNVLVGTNNDGPPVSVGQVTTTLTNLVAAVSALDP